MDNSGSQFPFSAASPPHPSTASVIARNNSLIRTAYKIDKIKKKHSYFFDICEVLSVKVQRIAFKQ